MLAGTITEEDVQTQSRSECSRADAGWKQLLEQEILHLQEHVESVNRDLGQNACHA
jgi:hypothetical protein